MKNLYSAHFDSGVAAGGAGGTWASAAGSSAGDISNTGDEDEELEDGDEEEDEDEEEENEVFDSDEDSILLPGIGRTRRFVNDRNGSVTSDLSGFGPGRMSPTQISRLYKKEDVFLLERGRGFSGAIGSLSDRRNSGADSGGVTDAAATAGLATIPFLYSLLTRDMIRPGNPQIPIR